MENAEHSGIDRFIVQSVATVPNQVDSIKAIHKLFYIRHLPEKPKEYP